jgi:hypothetical protein
MDLSTVQTRNRRTVAPRFAIPYDGYTGASSVRGAEEISKASLACGLPSPYPAALIIGQDKSDPKVLYGVPTMTKSPAYLALDWVEKATAVRANFQPILQAKQITIPSGMKMLVNVEYIEHPDLKACVKLSWAKDCFVPIHELSEEEKAAANRGSGRKRTGTGSTANANTNANANANTNTNTTANANADTSANANGNGNTNAGANADAKQGT